MGRTSTTPTISPSTDQTSGYQSEKVSLENFKHLIFGRLKASLPSASGIAQQSMRMLSDEDLDKIAGLCAKQQKY